MVECNMMIIIRISIISFSVLTLVSCGGGASGGIGNTVGNTGYVVADRFSATEIIGITPFSLTSQQIKERIESRLNDADTYFYLLTYLQEADNIDEVDISCSGTTCTFNAGDSILISSLEEIASGNFQSVMTHKDISLAQGAYSQTHSGVTFTTGVYGGWMDHSMFYRGEADLTTWKTEVYYGASIGKVSGSNPISDTAATTGTWTGVMVGADTSLGDVIQGDAKATVDFTDVNVDILFDNIFNLDTGDTRSDISWDNISLVDGRFSSNTGGEIDGSFYGPSHEEVGGVFEHGDSVGAFGAKRD